MRLYLQYEPMIRKLAKQFAAGNRYQELYDDLYQAACEEFLNSITKYDLEQKTNSFFSYSYGNIVFNDGSFDQMRYKKRNSFAPVG